MADRSARRSNPKIVRDADLNKDIAALTTGKGTAMQVTGLLADAVHDHAAAVAAGTAKTSQIEKFALAMAILYHEGTHVALWPLVGTSGEPAWYKKELANFANAKTVNNRVPTTEDFIKRVLDEAVGEYVEKRVGQYLTTFGKLMQAQSTNAGSDVIAALRTEYNSSMKASRTGKYGYWEVPPKTPIPGVKIPRLLNTTATLGEEAIAWADKYTGLTGNFDKDFALQIKSPLQPALGTMPGKR